MWVPLPVPLAREVQFYPQSRVFLGTEPVQLAHSRPPLLRFLGAFIHVRSLLYDDSGGDTGSIALTLALATHLFLAKTGLLHQESHRLSFIFVPFKLCNHLDGNSK